MGLAPDVDVQWSDFFYGTPVTYELWREGGGFIFAANGAEVKDPARRILALRRIGNAVAGAMAGVNGYGSLSYAN